MRKRGNVSDQYAVRSRHPPKLLDDRKAFAVWKTDADRFVLLDVVAQPVPSLVAIVGGSGVRPDVAEVLPPPDKLAWFGKPQPLDGATRFMIKAGLA
jgi:hypothetical protein